MSQLTLSTPETRPANVLGLLEGRAIVLALHLAGVQDLADRVDDILAQAQPTEQLLVLPVPRPFLELLRTC